MIMKIRSDILTESVPHTCLRGIALALIHHEFNPRFTYQCVLFLSPSYQRHNSFISSGFFFPWFCLRDFCRSAPYLWSACFHCDKIAFMKPRIRHGVIFCIFSTHCLTLFFFFWSSPARFIIHNYIC